MTVASPKPKTAAEIKVDELRRYRMSAPKLDPPGGCGTAAKMQAMRMRSVRRGLQNQNQNANANANANAPTRDRVYAAIALVRARQAARREPVDGDVDVDVDGDDPPMPPSPLNSPRSSPRSPPGTTPVRKAFAVDAQRHQSPLSSPLRLRAPLTPKTQEQPTSQKKARATSSPKPSPSSPGNASFFSNIFASRANSTGLISFSAMLPKEDEIVDQENSPRDAVAVTSPVAAAVTSPRSASRNSTPRPPMSPPSADRTDSPQITSNDSDEYSVAPETLTDVGRFIDALHGKQQGIHIETAASPLHQVNRHQQFLPPVSSDSSDEPIPVGPETLAGIGQYIDAIAKPKEKSMLAAATYSSDADDLVPLETKVGIGAFIDSLHNKSPSPERTKQTLYVSSSEDSSLDQPQSSDSMCHESSQPTGEEQLLPPVKEPETEMDNFYEKRSADLEGEAELRLDDILGDSVDIGDSTQAQKEDEHDDSRETSSHATELTLNPSDLAGEDFLEADLVTINEEFAASFTDDDEQGHVSSDGKDGDDPIISVRSGNLTTPPMPESPRDAGSAVQTAWSDIDPITAIRSGQSESKCTSPLTEIDPMTAIRSGFFESDSKSIEAQDLDTMDTTTNKRIQERIKVEEEEMTDLEGIEVPLGVYSSDRIESAIEAALAGDLEAACAEAAFARKLEAARTEGEKEVYVTTTSSDDEREKVLAGEIEAVSTEGEKEVYMTTTSSGDEREKALAGEIEAVSTEGEKELDNEARELMMTFHEGLCASSDEELEKGQLDAPDSPQSQCPLLKVFSAMESIDEDDNIQGFLTKLGAVEDGDFFSKLTPPIGASEDEIRKLNEMIMSVSKQTVDNDDCELNNGDEELVGAFLGEENTEMAREIITTTPAENQEPSSLEILNEDDKSDLVEALDDDTSTSVETSHNDKLANMDNLDHDTPAPADTLPDDADPTRTEALKDEEATLILAETRDVEEPILAQTLHDEEPTLAQTLDDEEPTLLLLAHTLDDEEQILAKSLDKIQGETDAVSSAQIVDNEGPTRAENPNDEELAHAENLDEIQSGAESDSTLGARTGSNVSESDSILAAIARSLDIEEPEFAETLSVEEETEFAETVGIDELGLTETGDDEEPTLGETLDESDSILAAIARSLDIEEPEFAENLSVEEETEFAETIDIDELGLTETGDDEEPTLGETLDEVQNESDADSVLAARTGSNASEGDYILAARTGSNVIEGDSILGARASSNVNTTSSVEFTVDDFARAFAPQMVGASFDDQSQGNASSEQDAAGELVDDSIDLVDAFLKRPGSYVEDIVAEDVPPVHIPFEPDRDEEENDNLRDLIATLGESDGEVFCKSLWGAPSAELKKWMEFIKAVAPFLSSESVPLVAEAQIRSVASRLDFPKAEEVEMIIEQLFGLQSASSGIARAASTDTINLDGVLHDEKFEDIEEVDDTENISAFLSRMTALKAGGHFGQVDDNHAEDLAVEVDVDHGFVNRQLQAALSDDAQWWHEETKMDTLEIYVTSPKANPKKVISDDELVSPKDKSKKKSASRLSTISPASTVSPRNHMGSRVARSRSKDFTPARELKKAPFNQMVRASRSYVHSLPSADIKPSLSLTQIPSSIGDFESMFQEREQRIIISNKARNAKWQNPWNKRFVSRDDHREFDRKEAVPLMPLMSKKLPRLSGVDAAKSLSKWSFRPDQRHKMPLKQHWRSAYKERTKNHYGYFNVDVYSVYETSVVIAKAHRFDEEPWERRDVKQRFLHEKSISLSRNWFGSLLRKRGNDRYREPVAHPKSMEMPMEDLPGEGEWVDEWYITWQQRQQGYKKQLGRPSESESDSYDSGDDSDGSETYTYADDGTNTLRDDDTSAYSASVASGSVSVYTSRGRSVYSRRHRNNSNHSLSQFDEEDDDYWEDVDPPECGTFQNTKQRIGERLSLVHYRHLSSLRQSRWRRKYFPRGTFPYNR